MDELTGLNRLVPFERLFIDRFRAISFTAGIKRWSSTH